METRAPSVLTRQLFGYTGAQNLTVKVVRVLQTLPLPAGFLCEHVAKQHEEPEASKFKILIIF